MVADHWFRQIEKVLEAMDITSDAACETLRKSNFLEKGKNHNFGKNPKFF